MDNKLQINKKNQILDAALQVFVKKGYSQLNKTISIDTDNKEVETTYIPDVPDSVDDEYENFTLIGTSSLIIISDTTSNDGGVFFGSYNSSNMVLIADPQNEFRNSDTNNYINCFKNGSTSTFQVKNRRGLTKNLSVAIIGCGA